MSHSRSLLDKIAFKLGYVPSIVKRSLHCAWCGEAFDWQGPTSPPHPLYCKESHRKKATEARKKRKAATMASAPKSKPFTKDLSTVGRCPTPYKQTHINFEKAREVILRVDPKMHPYRCPCGGIHIGH